MSTSLASFFVAVAAASIVQRRAALTRLSPASTACRLRPTDAAAFLDGMLPTSMAIGDIAGATVAIVKDDALLLTRAYGLADVEKQIPVSAQDTLFRPASISKLFTWTAVMQQVEAGKLDLDHDINEYLDFKIEGYGGQPIKLRHLMTHTAGFEESLLDLLVDDVERAQAARRRAEAQHPGAHLSAGHRARLFELRRVARRLHRRARVRHAVRAVHRRAHLQAAAHGALDLPSAGCRTRCAITSRRATHAASGEPVPFEYGSDAPAGALSATAPDMAQFMMAHLNGGLLPGGDDSNRILKPETTELMHSVANRPAPGRRRDGSTASTSRVATACA